MDEGTPEITLKIKLPFFLLGVIIGQAVVWASMQWVPHALASARAVVAG